MDGMEGAGMEGFKEKEKKTYEKAILQVAAVNW